MAKHTEKEEKKDFALGAENLKLIAIGLVIIVIGFILMTGGKSSDPNIFNPAIFSFRRITLSTLLVLFGFLFEIYAIMKIPKSDK
jgi:hypothetical protein